MARRTLRADEITDEWIGWYIRPLRDEFDNSLGGLNGFRITHGRTFELKSMPSWTYKDVATVDLVAKDYENPRRAGIAWHYSPDTVVELLRPMSAKAKKGANALGYPCRARK